MGLSRHLVELATQNGGFVSRDQLTASGVSTSAVDRLVNGGHIVAYKHGVYQVVPSNDDMDLIRGALLALPDGVASHQSAAALLRLGDRPFMEPTITVPSHTTHEFPGVTVRRADDLLPSHVAEVEGIPATTVARTLFDIAGVVHFRVFERVAESALITRRVTLEELDGVESEIGRRGKTGTGAVKTFVAHRLFAPESSVLERKGRIILYDLLPRSQPEYRVPWTVARRFDDAYPDHKLAIEWDSRSWHQRRTEMWNDRKRDREAVGHGWVVLRFTWEDVTAHPGAVRRAVADALKQRDPRRSVGS